MKIPSDPFDKPIVIPPKPAPQPQQEKWTPVERGNEIERNQDGRLRTNIPLNELASFKTCATHMKKSCDRSWNIRGFANEQEHWTDRL